MDIFQDFTENEYIDESPYEDIKEIDRGSYIPNHLSSPITIDDCKFLIKYDNFHCKRHISIKELLIKNNITKHIYNSCNDPYTCLKNYIHNEEVNESKLNEVYLRLIESSKISYSLHLFNYLENSINKNEIYKYEDYIDNIFDKLKDYKLTLFPHFLAMKKVEKIKDKICLTRVPFGNLVNNREINAERDIFTFNCSNHGMTIGPTNLLLCVLDIYQSRFSLLFYWVLSDIQNKYPIRMFDIAIKIINIIEDFRITMSNDTYKFLSSWESLVIGYSINDKENDLGFSKLFDTTLNDIKDLLRNYNLEFPEILLPSNRNDDIIKLYIELTGIIKHFGHPCLDIDEGFGEVKNIGNEVSFINQDIVNMSVGIFKRDFIKEYYNKKKRWPPLKNCPLELNTLYNSNLYPGRKFEKDYNLWNQIIFEKIFDYDYSPDTTELLKDSAAAPDLDQWFVPYDHCAFKLLHNKNKPKLSGKIKPIRVIEKYLCGDENDLKRKIYELEEGYYDINDSTASLCRKEQELKIKGRLFVKQTYIQRLIQTSMENNIAKQVMKYIPEQTMTDGEIQQMRRLSDAAKHQSRDLEIFNLDLSKWNLRFRNALVSPFGRCLDQMFGLKRLFSENHYWFLNAYVFNNSRLYPPDYNEDNSPIVGDHFYIGHLGGMEGMRQKLWTIITICLIKLSAEKNNLSIDIMCQGDNQVVMIRYQPRQVKFKEELRERFLINLSEDLESVNLSLKLEETWFSIRLCEFGKIRFFNGEAISSGTKKIYRMVPDINDGVCSIMSSLSTINTITEALAKYEFTPDTAFIINQFQLLNYLNRKKIISINNHLDDWVKFLFHPSDFGGITLSTYSSHFVRGNDDKIPIWLGIFQTVRRCRPELFKRIISLNQLEPLKGEINIRKLIEDIFSLNIRNLPTIENMFKQLSLKHITSPNVTNQEVKRLFSEIETNSLDNIVKQLKTMQPMVLSIAHEILRNSNAGILLSLRNRFTNIQTINKIVQDEYHQDFLNLMKNNNEKIKNILIKRNKNVESYFTLRFLTNECPTLLAKRLRKIHWDIDLLGETRSNILHQFRILPFDFCNNFEYNNSILIQLSNEYTNVFNTRYLKDGPYISYLGSATKEKVKKPTLEMSAKTSYTKALQQLHLMKTWLMRLGSENLVNLINDLIKEKISINVDDEENDYEEWCAMNYGGNILHRFRSIIERNSAVINFLPTVGTHFQQSTNRLAGITSGGRDFTIHFQLALITNIARIMKLKEIFKNSHPQYCSILDCNHCTTEITEVKFDIDQQESGLIPELIKKEHLILQEISYSIGELIDFLSIHLGREFGKAADTIFNKNNIDNKVTFTTRTVPSLNQISVNDLRYINLDLFFVGVIQGSRMFRTIILDMPKIGLIFTQGKMFEPLAQFLINSGLQRKFLDHYKIQGVEHSQIVSSERFSDLIIIGFFLKFWNTPGIYVISSISYWFKNDAKYLKTNILHWANKIINKEKEKEEGKKIEKNKNKNKNKSIIQVEKQSQIEYKNVKESTPLTFNKLKNNIFKHFSSTPSKHRSENLEEDEIIQLFRKHPKRGDSEIYKSRKYPLYQKLINYNRDQYIQNYMSFWEQINTVDMIESNFNIKDFHHLYRIKGNISTGINKILEIIYLTNINNDKSIKNIYCLAEGSGSILEGLGCLFDDSYLIYNTWLIPEIDKRNNPDLNFPPAILNSDRISDSRIFENNRLCLGETNIMSRNFHFKIISYFEQFKPDILTIDAESAENLNNFDILDKYIPLIFRYKIKLAIIKYYKRSNIDYKIPENEDYLIFPFKPFTSNPCNQEIYMVFLLRNNSCINKTIYRQLERLKGFFNSIKIIGNGHVLNTEIVAIYLNTGNWILDVLNLFNSISLPPDIFNFIPQKEENCKIYCITVIKNLCDLLDTINNFKRDDYPLHLIIREGGIFLFLVRLMKMITILILGMTTESGFTLLNYINTIVIPNNLRSQKELIQDCFLYTCYDVKSLIRRFTIDRMTNKKCLCKYEKRYFDNSRISGRLLNYLLMNGYISENLIQN